MLKVWVGQGLDEKNYPIKLIRFTRNSAKFLE